LRFQRNSSDVSASHRRRRRDGKRSVTTYLGSPLVLSKGDFLSDFLSLVTVPFSLCLLRLAFGEEKEKRSAEELGAQTRLRQRRKRDSALLIAEGEGLRRVSLALACAGSLSRLRRERSASLLSRPPSAMRRGGLSARREIWCAEMRTACTCLLALAGSLAEMRSALRVTRLRRREREEKRLRRMRFGDKRDSVHGTLAEGEHRPPLARRDSALLSKAQEGAWVTLSDTSLRRRRFSRAERLGASLRRRRTLRFSRDSVHRLRRRRRRRRCVAGSLSRLRRERCASLLFRRRRTLSPCTEGAQAVSREEAVSRREERCASLRRRRTLRFSRDARVNKA